MIRKENIDLLLDAETVKQMRKRPGMYIGGKDYKGIKDLFAHILNSVLHNSRETLTIEWNIEDDKICSLNIIGGNLNGLKEKLESFIAIDLLDSNDFSQYIYPYSFFLFFSQIEVSLTQDHEQLHFIKEQNTFIYDYQNSNSENQCEMKFVLDDMAFNQQAFLYEPLMEYVRNYAYQYPGLTIRLSDERELKQLNTYHFPNGLQDKLDYIHHMKHGGGPRMWEVQHDCTIDGCELKLYFYIAGHIYLHAPQEAIFAEDYLVLYHDQTIKKAVIKAMKQSMEEFSDKHNLELVFKETQLSFLTDFVASIHGDDLKYGTWKTELEMPELKENLTRHMKQYFDELFSSDEKYIKIVNGLGFKKGNTLFLDAVFASKE